MSLEVEEPKLSFKAVGKCCKFDVWRPNSPHLVSPTFQKLPSEFNPKRLSCSEMESLEICNCDRKFSSSTGNPGSSLSLEPISSCLTSQRCLSSAKLAFKISNGAAPFLGYSISNLTSKSCENVQCGTSSSVFFIQFLKSVTSDFSNPGSNLVPYFGANFIIFLPCFKNVIPKRLYIASFLFRFSTPPSYNRPIFRVLYFQFWLLVNNWKSAGS